MKYRMLGMALLMLIGMAGQPQTKFNRDFSADVVTSSDGHESTGRYYGSKSKIRMENFLHGKLASVMIIDLASKQFWMLRPQAKVAQDMSSLAQSVMSETRFQQPDPNNPCAALPGATCHKLGSETVNGRQTQKWEMKEKDGKVTDLWIDPTIPLAVKTQNAHLTGEFRNIKEEPQPDSLFQVPSDYRKMSFGFGKN